MDLKYKPRKATTRIILHDSHTAPGLAHPAEALRHTARHMGLLEAGYHFAVARDGKVFTLRHHMSIGTHTPGHNHDSLGVCLIGGRDDSGNPAENFSEGQIESLVRLLRVWASRMGAGTVGDIPVVGHSEIQRFRNRSHPPCPFLDMEELRRRLVGDRR